MSLRIRGESVEAEAHLAQGRITLRAQGQESTHQLAHVGDATWCLDDGASRATVVVARSRAGLWVHAEGRAWLVERGSAAGGAGGATDGSLVAPMTGKVLEVLAAEGDAVTEGQVILVVSAMKMRVDIRAPHAGTLRRLAVAAGSQVDGGTVIAVVEAP